MRWLESITNSRSLLRFTSIESVMPSNHLILCLPLVLLPSIFSSIRVFSNELALCIRCPKYLNFSFSISQLTEYSGLLSFKIDWFDLPALQGILKSLLQHPNLKASILWRTALFMVQLSHPYMTTGKIIAVTIKRAECQRIDAFELWYWRDSWESLGLQGAQTSQL